MGQIIYPKRDYPTTGKIAYPSRKNMYSPVLYLKFENNLLDSSPTNKTVINNGITFNNSIVKKDSYSGYFSDSTSTFCYINDHSDFNFTNQDFTIEAWIYPINFLSSRTLISKWRSGNYSWQLIVYPDKFLWSINNDIYTSILFTSGNTLQVDTWSHIAISKRSGIIRTFLNYVLENTHDETGVTYNSTSQRVEIGRNGDVAWPFYGYIDELKIYKGVGIY